MKRIFYVILVLAALLSLSGCGNGKAEIDLTAVLPGNVSSLDPQTASGTSAGIVIGSIFEGLCTIDENSDVQPGVADRWDHNRDFTQFTFHLRKSKWSNGEAVTADDFVFAVVRALQHDNGATSLDDVFIIKNAQAFYNGECEAEKLGIYAKNERTLVVELERGYEDFPALTAGRHYMPCNREYFEECSGHYGLSSQYIITNGPFTITGIYAWNTDYNERSISLTSSANYRGENQAKANSLTYLIDYDDAIDNDPVNSLLKENVDILTVPEATARTAEEQGCGVIAVNDGVTGLLLNSDDDDLGYVKMRELFISVLDREAVVSVGLNDTVSEAQGIMPECVRVGGEKYYAENESCYAEQSEDVSATLSQVKSLLGLEKIPSITVLCADDEASVAVANSMLMTWNEKLGNAFNILSLSESELKSRVANGDYEAALYTLKAGGSSPFNVLSAFESSAYPTLLSSRDFDSALHGMNFSQETCRELELELQEQYVFYPIFTARTYYALSPKLSGITVSPNGQIDFSKAVKKK